MTTQPPPHTRRCGLKKPVICREESETPQHRQPTTQTRSSPGTTRHGRSGLSLKAFGRHEGRDLLILELGDEAAGSSSWVETLDIGGFVGLPEGEVYFEVEVEHGATWTLTVTRL